MQTSSARLDSHDDYQPMLDAVLKKFSTVAGGTPLFTTDATDLWKTWLEGLPEHERQHHNCHACRRFIETYGGLVTIDADGYARPAMIPIEEAHESLYYGAFAAVDRALISAKVTGVFVSSAMVYGLPENIDRKRNRTWRHMHVRPLPSMVYRGSILTAGQRAAELREDHATLCRALADFKLETLQQAHAIGGTDALYRAEKVAGRLRWLLDVREARDAAKGRARDNIAWRAAAMAPAGFCHVRSSVVGSLLEDLEAGKSFEEVKRAFDAKMDPLKYQRPTAPPSDGNIKQAEAIVEKLGSAGSLRRRFARVEDLKTLWLPSAPSVDDTKKGGVFAHLYGASEVDRDFVTRVPTMTWTKFASTVLQTAEQMSLFVPHSGGFHAFCTAVDPSSPPIIQWDPDPASGHPRNPVTWYTYPHGGSTASQWKLTANTWVDVTAVSHMPNMWSGDGFPHHGAGALLVLKGCVDQRNESAAIFPELLKSEYHSVRSTIEAFSRRSKLEGQDEASACGIAIRSGAGASYSVKLRARAGRTVAEYTIDRWD